MYVVLEGPDGAGKTTLADLLKKRYACEGVHNGPPSPGSTSASLTREYAADISMPNPGGLVVDRWALGETVYGPLFRGGSLIRPIEWQALRNLLDATCTPLVLCLPPRAVAMANWRARKADEQFKDERLVGLAHDKYAAWATVPGAYPQPRNFYVYDYTSGPVALEKLHAFLDRLKEQQ